MQEQLTIWAKQTGETKRVSIRSAPWRLNEAIQSAQGWRSYQRGGWEVWITKGDGDIESDEVWWAAA